MKKNNIIETCRQAVGWSMIWLGIWYAIYGTITAYQIYKTSKKIDESAEGIKSFSDAVESVLRKEEEDA